MEEKESKALKNHLKLPYEEKHYAAEYGNYRVNVTEDCRYGKIREISKHSGIRAFALRQLTEGLVVYQHDGSENHTDS